MRDALLNENKEKIVSILHLRKKKTCQKLIFGLLIFFICHISVLFLCLKIVLKHRREKWGVSLPL